MRQEVGDRFHGMAVNRRFKKVVFLRAGLWVFLLLWLTACGAPRMSVEEARQVTIAVGRVSFTPPPRRSADILEILEQPGRFDAETSRKFLTLADADPPDTDRPETRMKFYLKRGKAAFELGRSRQALMDLRRAKDLADRITATPGRAISSRRYTAILNSLANAEVNYGNFRKAIELEKRILGRNNRLNIPHRLARKYILLGELETAETILKKGIADCNAFIDNPRKPERAKMWVEMQRAQLHAISKQFKGNYRDAEGDWRFIVDTIFENPDRPFAVKEKPRAYLNMKRQLSANLFEQKRFGEAEFHLREAIRASIGFSGADSAETVKMVRLLAQIFLFQGRLEEAQKLADASVRLLRATGTPEDSLQMAHSRFLQGNVAVAQEAFDRASEIYAETKKALAGNEYYFDARLALTGNYILTLIKTGRAAEAVPAVDKAIRKMVPAGKELQRKESEFLGYRAMARAVRGDTGRALADFQTAIPGLFRRGLPRNPVKRVRFLAIADAYLELLNQIRNHPLPAYGGDAAAEIFLLCQQLNQSSLVAALGAGAARWAAGEPGLARLVRSEQDAADQRRALETILSEALNNPPGQNDPEALMKLRKNIEGLDTARHVILDRVKKAFPKYREFTTPRPLAYADVQAQLRPGEALLAIYPRRPRTYVWAIPHHGKVAFAVAPLTRTELHNRVASLRGSVVRQIETLGDIPAFDTARAHELYRFLLAPVSTGWHSAKTLLIVAPGPLGPLPFSVIPTEPGTPDPEKVLFAGYRAVPWLIREVALSRLPSVSALGFLRAHGVTKTGRRPFAGFGDPIFNPGQVASLTPEPPGFHQRGIRITENGRLDSQKMNSCTLAQLQRLPDTGDEILAIAGAVKADPEKDVFLHQAASEARVKSMDLGDRKIIAFATHALIPGDLDGLDQPAIALSSPAVTGEAGDGLLTMEEVLRLKLNADWVVLSACNTGAAGGEGAEALSGLGRAFFYAGTKALLASMWAVETTAAKRLTSRLFELQTADPDLTHSQALRRSMLELMDGPGWIDPASGKIVASYAHPLFWAPFVVVGEGAGRIE